MTVTFTVLKGRGVVVDCRFPYDPKYSGLLKARGYSWDGVARTWSRRYDLDPDFGDYADKADEFEAECRWLKEIGAVLTTTDEHLREALREII